MWVQRWTPGVCLGLGPQEDERKPRSSGEYLHQSAPGRYDPCDRPRVTVYLRLWIVLARRATQDYVDWKLRIGASYAVIWTLFRSNGVWEQCTDVEFDIQPAVRTRSLPTLTDYAVARLIISIDRPPTTSHNLSACHLPLLMVVVTRVTLIGADSRTSLSGRQQFSVFVTCAKDAGAASIRPLKVSMTNASNSPITSRRSLGLSPCPVRERPERALIGERLTGRIGRDGLAWAF